jgi:hypothetical protein
MRWAPLMKTREAIKFWLDCFQVVAVFGGVAAVAITYFSYKSNQAIELQNQIMELQKPFNEKQLELYVEAAQVAARIAEEIGTTSGADAVSKIDRDTVVRFWELYYGQLVFVESSGVNNSVATKMNDFCVAVFEKEKCSKSADYKDGITTLEKLAITLANTASAEIKNKWRH